MKKGGQFLLPHLPDQTEGYIRSALHQSQSLLQSRFPTANGTPKTVNPHTAHNIKKLPLLFNISPRSPVPASSCPEKELSRYIAATVFCCHFIFHIILGRMVPAKKPQKNKADQGKNSFPFILPSFFPISFSCLFMM